MAYIAQLDLTGTEGPVLWRTCMQVSGAYVQSVAQLEANAAQRGLARCGLFRAFWQPLWQQHSEHIECVQY